MFTLANKKRNLALSNFTAYVFLMGAINLDNVKTRILVISVYKTSL